MRGLICVLLIALMGCNGHLQGSAASLPTSLPCEKNPDPEPVKFSCKRAVQIINRLKACEQKDDECKRKTVHVKKLLEIDCSAKLKHKDQSFETEKQQHKIVQKALQKKALQEIIVWSLVAGAIGTGAGVVIGFFAGRGTK